MNISYFVDKTQRKARNIENLPLTVRYFTFRWKKFRDKRFKFRSRVFYNVAFVVVSKWVGGTPGMSEIYEKQQKFGKSLIFSALFIPFLSFLGTIFRNHHKLVLFILRMSGSPDNFIISFFLQRRWLPASWIWREINFILFLSSCSLNHLEIPL